MTKTQQKIDLELDANRILSTLQLYPPSTIWTPTVFSDVLGWGVTRANSALLWLESKGYISVNLGEYRTTMDGTEYYKEFHASPQLESDSHTWTTEARTGLRTHGPRNNPDWQRSPIKRAAIPCDKPMLANDATPEDAYGRAESAARQEEELANMLGVSVDEYRRLQEEGRVKMCRGVDGEEHLGKFHRMGKRLQHLCVECSREKRGRK